MAVRVESYAGRENTLLVSVGKCGQAKEREREARPCESAVEWLTFESGARATCLMQENEHDDSSVPREGLAAFLSLCVEEFFESNRCSLVRAEVDVSSSYECQTTLRTSSTQACGGLWSYPLKMIHFVLLLNRQGRTRLSRWYEGGLTDVERLQLESGVHAAVLQRQRRWSNICDFRSYRLVYRQYAGLVFVVCIDSVENDLAIYEAIQLFVEVLDKYFGTVCELDVIFHVDKVYYLLDQFIQAGDIVQTSTQKIVERAKRLDNAD
ncbi:UNVERIFIED_CONTAM: hypothetical protein H355_007870 [Colinus virginianus]|nr:hypothetical protein H355_007870 [Colinus virginianus]